MNKEYGWGQMNNDMGEVSWLRKLKLLIGSNLNLWYIFAYDQILLKLSIIDIIMRKYTYFPKIKLDTKDHYIWNSEKVTSCFFFQNLINSNFLQHMISLKVLIKMIILY